MAIFLSKFGSKNRFKATGVRCNFQGAVNATKKGLQVQQPVTRRMLERNY